MYGFVIPTFRRADLPATCVATLRACEPDRARWRAFVVNDGGPPAVRAQIAAMFAGDPQVTVILKEANEGFSKTVNAGMRAALAAGASRLVLTNDDIEFRWPVIDAIEAAFGSDPAIGVVGAKLFYPDGRLQHAGMWREGPFIRHRWHGWREPVPESDAAADCVVTAALQAIRAETAQAIGLYDEGYFMAWEDTDYCLRALKAGWRVIYWPGLRAIHAESATRGKPGQMSAWWIRAQNAGHERFMAAWGRDYRHMMRVAPRPPLVFAASADDRRAVLEDAAGKVGELRARGWDARLWSVGPWPGADASFGDRRALAAALGPLRGVRIASSPSLLADISAASDESDLVCAEAHGFPDGPPLRGALADWAPAPGRRAVALCASGAVARSIGNKRLADPVVLGHGVGRPFFAAGAGGRRGTLALSLAEEDAESAEVAVAAASATAQPGSWGGDEGLASLMLSRAVYIHPYRRPEHARLLARAMAAGLACVVRPSAANLDLCRPGLECVVAESPRDLASAAAALVADQAALSALSAAVRAAAARLRWEDVADRLEDVVESWLAGGRRFRGLGHAGAPSPRNAPGRHSVWRPRSAAAAGRPFKSAAPVKVEEPVRGGPAYSAAAPSVAEPEPSQGSAFRASAPPPPPAAPPAVKRTAQCGKLGNRDEGRPFSSSRRPKTR